MLALRAGTSTAVKAGKVISVPPPANALTAPAAKVADATKPRSSALRLSRRPVRSDLAAEPDGGARADAPRTEDQRRPGFQGRGRPEDLLRALSRDRRSTR